VKVEPGLQSVTILSDDSDMSSPLQAMLSKTTSRMSPSLDPPIESPAYISKTFSEPGLKQPNSIVDCLRKLHASKGSGNAFKGLDYNVVKLFRVDFLPPVFNGDVVYELPPMGSSFGNSQAKFMVGMDKQHNGHAWTKTITSHIKNDMGLTFCTSSCIGHLHCDNQDYEYLSCVYRTYPLNETKWDGSTPTSFLVGCQLRACCPSYSRTIKHYPPILPSVGRGYIMSLTKMT
jgi:hypothetical protein